LGVTFDTRFGGWVPAAEVRAVVAGGGSLADVALRDPVAQIAPSSSLRAAMELIMVSNSSVAVIDDDGRFGGVVTLEDIRRALASGGSRDDAT
jgi:CBS domain-containing protein